MILLKFEIFLCNKENIFTLEEAKKLADSLSLNFFADNNLIKKLEDKNLIAFKYCDEKGNINENSNPNGSLENIAGILNSKKNILGMMPHPERMIDQSLSGEDGSVFFDNIINNLN